MRNLQLYRTFYKLKSYNKLTKHNHSSKINLSSMEHRLIQYLLKNQVIFALFLLVTGWLAIQLRDIITSIFISYIIMAALIPLVSFLHKRGIPRLISVLIVYFGLLIVGVLIIFPLAFFGASQINSLIIGFPEYLGKTAKALGTSFDAAQVQNYITRELDIIGSNAFIVTQRVFGGIFSIFTILIVSFYLLLSHDTFKKQIVKFFHEKDRETAYKVFQNVDDKLGSWLRGQVILCTVIFSLTYFALSLIGIPNAFPLAILAGLLEAFPTIGPVLSAIPAVIVAFTISPAMVISVILVYIVIQLLENNLIVPKIMERAVGINPIIVIIGVTTGAALMGVIGALISIPFISFVVSLSTSIKEMSHKST